MAVEGDIPANIADHVQRELSVVSSQVSSDAEAPEMPPDLDMLRGDTERSRPLQTELITDD
jgi:hypothetical protein